MKTLLVIDIDNTVAENAQREHLLPDWKAFFHACDTDTPIEPIIEALQPLFDREDIDIIFVTGRSAYWDVKKKTQKWLDEHFPKRPVFYRPLNNYTKSHIYKDKVINGYRTDEHTRLVVIDDDLNICSHFEQQGHVVVAIDKDKYLDNAQLIGASFAPRTVITP